MARRRPPTDELGTEIYDSQQRSRGFKQTKKGFESGDITVPEPTTVEIGTPTEIDPPRKERSEPIRVISMKTPAELAAENKAKTKAKLEAKHHKPEIRALSDVIRDKATPPRGMGYLAPPANAKERNVRKLRDWLIWGSVLVIISCVVMLAVWFLAGRG